MFFRRLQIAFSVVVFSLFLFGCHSSSKNTQPDESRFRKKVLAQGKDHLHGAVNFDIAPDGRLFIIDLEGRVQIYDIAKDSFQLSGHFDGGEFGLIGIRLDPEFAKNSLLYLQYFVADPTPGPEGLKRRTMRVSRFKLDHDTIDMKSEQCYLQIPYEFECCHTGGGIDFDTKGNLYVSTGDNTGAFFSQYSPVTDLPGHYIDDGLRSSGNTNDDRGKILRIHPNADSGYSIPAGNLFPASEPKAKPEIYVMGVRNPFRITIDKTTDILYWGEVGPDGGKDSAAGPRGYDEFNQAKAAGNFGWPLIIANNKGYAQISFATDQSDPGQHFINYGARNDTAHPYNGSSHNTGLRDLPPAHPALIWYPYDSSDAFPSFGAGGRTAICGPFYQYDQSLESKVKFPAWFDHAWFIGDWMRNWLKVVHFKDDNSIDHIDDFLPHTSFVKPVAMRFGPDGALYVLEFGTTWTDNNPDVALSRIEYLPGNRPPVARIGGIERSGSDLLNIVVSGDSSSDADNDALQFEWHDSTGRIIGRDKTLQQHFTHAGNYRLQLVVRDPEGAEARVDSVFWAGRAPSLTLNIANRSFFWDTIKYSITVTDGYHEITPRGDETQVSISELSPVSTMDDDPTLRGEVLLNESDCKACHQQETRSVGPAFSQVVAKYRDEPNIIPALARKVISGGSGIWGNTNMSAHPQLSTRQAEAILHYIFSLHASSNERKIPMSGMMKPERSKRYLLSVKYPCCSSLPGQLSMRDSVMLRSALIGASSYDKLYDADAHGDTIASHTYGFCRLRQVDLENIDSVRFDANGPMELRLDNENGEVLAMADVKSGFRFQKTTLPLPVVKGVHDVCVVFARTTRGFLTNQQLAGVQFIRVLRN